MARHLVAAFLVLHILQFGDGQTLQKAEMSPPVYGAKADKCKGKIAGPAFDARNYDEFDTSPQKPFPLKKPIPGCGLATPHCEDSPFRNIDGSCNNLKYPLYGVPNSPYLRILPAEYGDGIRTARRGHNNAPLPSSRLLRTALFPTGTKNSSTLNLNAMEWAQLIAHDMSMLAEPDDANAIPCCTVDSKYKKNYGPLCFPIKIPRDDKTIGKAGIECINFTRTVTDQDFGCGKKNEPAKQLSTVTSWMDLSFVYGVTDEKSQDLRTKNGGKLKTQVINSKIWPPNEPDKEGFCPCSGDKDACFDFGDVRTSQNPQLVILQVLFLREHNRLANKLAEVNPHWNDERLFQEARRINIAGFQKATYYEWAPLFFGKKNALKTEIIYETDEFVNDYNEEAKPGVSNEHAHAAFRFFHTNIVGLFNMYNAARKTVKNLKLSFSFTRPQVVVDNMNALTLGMVTQNMEASDQTFVEEISDRLDSCKGEFGSDLHAEDLQRDRDHALAYYNDYREHCGLKRATCFEDYLDLISPENVKVLKKNYNSYCDVDLTIGGGLEKLVPGAQVGPTFLCILQEQFSRTRKADRYWFENEDCGFTIDQLKEIRKTSVAKFFCNNGDGITSMQRKGFELISALNPLVNCSKIKDLDFKMWKECVEENE